MHANAFNAQVRQLCFRLCFFGRFNAHNYFNLLFVYEIRGIFIQLPIAFDNCNTLSVKTKKYRGKYLMEEKTYYTINVICVISYIICSWCLIANINCRIWNISNYCISSSSFLFQTVLKWKYCHWKRDNLWVVTGL